MPMFLLLAALLQTSAAAPAPKEVPPISMPADRADESYKLYSSLLPLGETASKGWPRELFLIQELTVTLVRPDQPCDPLPKAGARGFDMGMNPHASVHAPNVDQQDFLEILADWDTHCHERIKLDAGALKLPAPVLLLDKKQQEEFQETRHSKDPAKAEIVAKYKGASSLNAFSEVYFNHHHTVAMVYATHWCGGLCGQGFWLAFRLQDGQWKPLQWAATSWIS